MVNKKVINNETTRPKVIIKPKSIIGLIPLNTKDKKAQMVVKIWYIKLVATFFYQPHRQPPPWLVEEILFLIVKNLTVT